MANILEWVTIVIIAAFTPGMSAKRKISFSVSKISTSGVKTNPGRVCSADDAHSCFSFTFKSPLSIVSMTCFLHLLCHIGTQFTVICLGFTASALGTTIFKTPSFRLRDRRYGGGHLTFFLEIIPKTVVVTMPCWRQRPAPGGVSAWCRIVPSASGRSGSR